MAHARTRQAATWLLMVWVVIGFASDTRAQGPLPQLTAAVNDFASVVDAESEREMTRRALPPAREEP